MDENQVHIPDGWIEISQLANLSKVYNGLSGKKKDDFGEGEPYIPYVNVFKNSRIDPSELDYVKVKIGERQNAVEYGDIIFTTSSETIDEVGMTSVFLESSGKYYLNSFCFILRLNNKNWLNPEFAQYLFRSTKVRYSISLLGQGSTRYNLSKTRLLKELKLIIPSDTTEQTTIARILSKVDEAIAQTEQLIAKYTRIKTGLMQDLLTKGIDEQRNIRSEQTHAFKDSPLGRIPKEWECDTLISFCEKIQDGTHFSPKTDSNGEYKYITSKNIRMGYLDLNNLEYINEDAHKKIYKRCSVKYGDVLLTKDGASTGNICLNPLDEEFSLLSSVALVRGKKGKLLNEYIVQFFMEESGQKSLIDQMSGNAITRITLTKINKTQIKVPQFDEQQRIIQNLKPKDNLITQERIKLSKLQSLKTGLMQDLLSGKVRVNHLIKETESV